MTASRLTILSWNARGGGRAKALLALANYCHEQGLAVTVALGGDWAPAKLSAHHGQPITFDVYRTDFREETPPAVEDAIAETAPDVVVAFDTLLIKACRHIDPPTVGYLRTSAVPGVEEYWAPSRHCAAEFTAELRGRGEPDCHPVYPVWYIDALEDPPPDADRPIDVMVHGRKARDAVVELNPEYNVLVANRFTYPELRALYRQTKVFLFPRPERFEPLGLMPVEAAATGCRPLVPDNSGVAEIVPHHVHEHPTEHAAEAIDAGGLPEDPMPESPTDPAERIQNLA